MSKEESLSGMQADDMQSSNAQSTDPVSRYETKMLKKALELYTLSKHEGPMAEFLTEKCKELGFTDIRIDDVGNVIAKKGNGAPNIMLCGHMDVVPGKIQVRIEGDYLYGRGASDAKAPLMAMLFTAAAIPKDQGTVTFVGAIDEEGNATGIKNLVKEKMDIDYAIFGEPSGTKQVTIAYKGRLAINLRVRSKDSSHASAPWLSKNAITESMAFATRLKEELEGNQSEEEERKSKIITATVTMIRGGTSHNVTPSECETTFDIRIPVGSSCKETEQRVATLVQEAGKQLGVDPFYSILDETEPFEAPHNSPLVRAFTLSGLKTDGERPRLVRKTGTGDMNVLGYEWKIPVVTYGPGDPHEAHTKDEKVSIKEYLKGIEILKETLKQLKMLHDKKIARAVA